MNFVTTEEASILQTPFGSDKAKAAHKNLVAEKMQVEADGNVAAAYATLQMWRCMIYPGFPITPSTKWLQFVSAKVASGAVGLKRVKLLEAEHAVADYMAGSGRLVAI